MSTPLPIAIYIRFYLTIHWNGDGQFCNQINLPRSFKSREPSDKQFIARIFLDR